MALQMKEIKVLWHRVNAMERAEIVYRIKRQIRAQREKFRKPVIEPVDKFLKRQGIGPGQLELFISKMRSRIILPWQSPAPETRARLFNNEWYHYKSACLKRAEEILRHRFRVFERIIEFQDQIDWHWDAAGERTIPLKYWTDIHYWRSEHVADVKYVWELNRHQHFVTLGKAYSLTGDERFSRELFDQWMQWLDANPPNFGVNWTSPLELALRIISWTWALQMAKNSAHLTERMYASILQHVDAHASFITANLSQYSSANNHLIGESVGLIYAGTYYPELKNAHHWRDLGFRIFVKQIPRQVHDDGVIKEQSSCYQRYNFNYCVLAQLAAEYTGHMLPEIVSDRMRLMAHFINALTDDAGNVPMIGDDDGGQVLVLNESGENTWRTLLGTAAVLFRSQELKTGSCGFKESSFWLLGMHGKSGYDAITTAKRMSQVYQFPSGGYLILDCVHEKLTQHMVFDAGPLGFDKLASHGHADALSMTLTVNGSPCLIDPGTFTYRGETKWRNFFRSSAAHNTVTIGGYDQSEILGPFQWGTRAKVVLESVEDDEAQTVVSGWHDGYESLGVIHKREIIFEKYDYWQIIDDLSGQDQHDINLFWHLAPCHVEKLQDGSVVCDFDRFVCTFVFLSSVELDVKVISGREEPPQGWYSPGFGRKFSNPVLCVNTNNELPLQIKTVIKIKTKDEDI